MKMRILSIIGAIVLTSVQINAQNVSTPSNGAGNVETANSDYVTIGSRVPYYVATDAAIQAMTTAGTMKESIFRWFVTDATSTPIAGVPVLGYAGAAATQYNDFRVVTAATGYYDNEISLVWNVANGFVAGTQYAVGVAEKSVTLSPTVAGCEDATPVTKNVFVLAQSTVAFDGTEGGGCTVAPGSTFYVPLNVTGLGDWDVTYTISYNGGAASASSTYTLTLADPVAVTDLNVVAESVLSRPAAGTPTSGTDGLAIVLPALQFGYYDIAITSISDRIGRKSLLGLSASPASGTYRIYVNPVPVTEPINHIKNL